MRRDRLKRHLALAAAAAATLAAAVAAPATAAPLPASGTLDLAEGADARLTGGAAGDLAGVVVRPAGDVNGDGKPDLLVGAPSADARGRDQAGVVYVVFGPSADLPTELDELGTRGLRIEGAAARDHLGVSVAAAGDVNGDGLGDLLLGAPRADARAQSGSGAAYLVFGARESGTLDLAAPGTRVRTLTTGLAGDLVGAAVDSVPDTDGDGRPELAIGAPRSDESRAKDAGAVFLVFAKALGGDVDLNELGDRGMRLNGGAGDRAGFAVAGAPDFNGDGRGELLVGAPLTATVPAGRTGAGYVVFGRAEAGQVDLPDLGAGGFAVTGGADDERLGSAVAVVGDPNGDKVLDLAFAANSADRLERKDSGSVHVFPAKATPEPVAVGAADRPGFRIDGAAAGDELGISASPVGDMDGDAFSELVVTAPEADALSRDGSGAAYVIFGDAALDDIDLSGLVDRGFRLAGPDAGSHLRSAASPGDLDGDGVADLIAGAYTAGDTDSGAAYVVLGPKPPPPPPPPDPGVAEELAAGCKAVTNVEVIVDDSFSMRTKDPELLRRQAIELLLTKPRNEGKVIGAYEFGTTGNQLFAPQVIQPRGIKNSNQPLLAGSLQQGIQGDNGGTDYNLAFKGAADDNPAAQARIFITDGGHRAGDYLDLHRGGAPTYVVGLAISPTSTAGRRLGRIAEETKGRAFVDIKAEDMTKTLNSIDSALNCDVDIDADEDVLSEEDPVEQQVIELLPDARTCDIDVSWGDDDDQIEPEEIAFLEEDGSVAARVTSKGLRRVVRKPGKTFTINGITLKGRKRGSLYGLRIAGSDPATRLRVKYRAAKVAGKNAAVTSQVTQSRRRNVDQPRRRG